MQAMAHKLWINFKYESSMHPNAASGEISQRTMKKNLATERGDRLG